MIWIIYKHTSPNGKCYIGQTYRKPEERWGKNGSNYDTAYKFGKAIKLYGWSNFKHEIIEDQITSQQEADKREKYWIAYFDSYKHGYNMTLGGQGIVSDANNIGLYQIGIDKNIIKHFNSISEASRELDIPMQNIGQCLLGKQITAKGFYFLPESIDVNDFELPKSRYQREVICVETQIVYSNLKETAKKTKISYSAIAQNCARLSIQTNGYHFAYLDEYDDEWKPLESKKDYSWIKRQKIICVETGQTWNSIIDCSIETGILAQNLSQNCCMNHRSAKGKHFAYIEEFNDSWKPAMEYNTKRRKESSTLTKRVYCLQTNKFYESATLCADELNLTPREVSRCAKKDGDLIQTHGYNFCYEEDWFDGWKPRESIKGKHPLSIEQKCALLNKNGIMVRCIETNITYNSAKEAMRMTGIHSDSICRVCKKTKGSNTAGGYHWEYVGGNTKK